MSARKLIVAVTDGSGEWHVGEREKRAAGLVRAGSAQRGVEVKGLLPAVDGVGREEHIVRAWVATFIVPRRGIRTSRGAGLRDGGDSAGISLLRGTTSYSSGWQTVRIFTCSLFATESTDVRSEHVRHLARWRMVLTICYGTEAVDEQAQETSFPTNYAAGPP